MLDSLICNGGALSRYVPGAEALVLVIFGGATLSVLYTLAAYLAVKALDRAGWHFPRMMLLRRRANRLSPAIALAKEIFMSMPRWALTLANLVVPCAALMFSAMLSGAAEARTGFSGVAGQAGADLLYAVALSTLAARVTLLISPAPLAASAGRPTARLAFGFVYGLAGRIAHTLDSHPVRWSVQIAMGMATLAWLFVFVTLPHQIPGSPPTIPIQAVLDPQGCLLVGQPFGTVMDWLWAHLPTPR
jgi:hypothetical protein